MKGKYTKWLEPENLTLIEGWARDGLTYDQIAHNIGIRRETLFAWAKTYSNISNALKRGREIADYEVENALYRSAIGYEYEEDTLVKEGDKTVIKKIKKHMAGNTTAQIFWLKNRKPEQWKDRRETAITTSITPEAIDEVEEFLNGFSCGEKTTTDSAED